MAQIGTIEVQTQSSGTVQLPVFDIGDSGGSVYEMVRVPTPSGVGFIPAVAPGSAAFPQLRVPTQNNGILALHNEASLFTLPTYQQKLVIENYEDGSWSPSNGWAGWYELQLSGGGGYYESLGSGVMETISGNNSQIKLLAEWGSNGQRGLEFDLKIDSFSTSDFDNLNIYLTDSDGTQSFNGTRERFRLNTRTGELNWGFSTSITTAFSDGGFHTVRMEPNYDDGVTRIFIDGNSQGDFSGANEWGGISPQLGNGNENETISIRLDNIEELEQV